MSFKIVDKGWRKFIYNLRKAKQSYSKVGFPSEGKVRKGTQKGSSHEPKETMIELAQLAAIHEFGAPSQNIPSRPFVRPTYDESLNKLEKMAYKELIDITIGRSNVKRSLGRMGEFLAGEMKSKIKEGDFVPLKPLTIARKNSSKPLIDIAQMLQSITHVEHII
jgi:hypothetical protein